MEDDLRLTEKQQSQGSVIMGLTKPDYRSRNSTSPTSRARTSSASSEEACVKSRETSPTRLKPSSLSPTNFCTRASSASSSSEESVEPRKSSRKKYDKSTERVGHVVSQLQLVDSPKALPNVAAKHVQTFVQEASWRDNSFYVHGDLKISKSSKHRVCERECVCAHAFLVCILYYSTCGVYTFFEGPVYTLVFNPVMGTFMCSTYSLSQTYAG